MASLASQDAPTYNLQPHPTSPSLTISYFILVLPVAHSPSTTHHTTLSTLPNVSHIARCIIHQLITTPATLSIRPGVIPRVSVADHCSIVPCIAKNFQCKEAFERCGRLFESSWVLTTNFRMRHHVGIPWTRGIRYSPRETPGPQG